MIAIAKAIFVGVTTDRVITQTNNGKSMMTFKLKTWRPVKDRDDKICFFDVVAYAGAADTLNKYLTDKKTVYLECTSDQYRDSSDGKFRVQFVVNEFTFIGDNV